MKKRGISELVTTVLIIGFTIALAAVIIVWGLGFIKNMQHKVEDQSETKLLCSKVSLDVKKTCWDDQKIFLMVENMGSLAATHLRIMIFSEESSGEAVTEKEVEIGGLKTYTVDYDKAKLGEINRIRVLPYVKRDGKTEPCDPIDKEINDCVVPGQPEPVLPDVNPTETLKITYKDGGSGGDGGDGGDGGETPTCGDGSCNAETCTTCPTDCLAQGQICCDSITWVGDCCTDSACTSPKTCVSHVCTTPSTYCGNGICDTGETCNSCSTDCGCNDGYTCTSGTCTVDKTICETAEHYGLCEVLDVTYEKGFQALCCSEHGACC